MSLTADGVWKGHVWASTVWGLNVWYEPTTTITTPLAGGGGGKHKGDWYRYYRNPSEDRVRPIASEIRELYEAAIEISPINELPAIHAIVDNYVEKPTDDYARLPIIPAPVIDWAALVNDLEQVYALARLYDKLIDEEEAAFLLLM
jgi:hypothetical protein